MGPMREISKIQFCLRCHRIKILTHDGLCEDCYEENYPNADDARPSICKCSD